MFGSINVHGNLKYANLRNVVICVFSIPFLDVERLFSILRLKKAESRNWLKRESIAGLMFGKEGFKSLGVHANELNLNHHPKLLKLVQNVKTKATDSEASEILQMY